MLISSLCATSVRARLALSGLLLAAASLSTGCAAEADERGPQFPQPPQQQGPIGTAGTPREDLLQAQATEEATVSEPEVVAGNDSEIIGGDDAPPPIASPGEDEYADTDPSALTDFHAALDPYGQWVEDPSYGTIWQPSASAVGSDFAPYETAGHWTYGDDYTWVSDYAWGWAPFHYGRWVYATNGWGWIPGRRYAGAWTSWRRGYGAYSGYVGWAPLPPTYTWRGGTAVGIGVVPPAPYAFCSTGNLFAHNLAGRMATGPQVGAIGPNTRPTTGALMGRGPGGTGVAGVRGGSGPFAGRTAAHPETSGPTPQSMHIAQNAIARPPMNNAGLNRAAQFAHPSTAVALGARPGNGMNGARIASGTRGGSFGGGASGGVYRPYASSMGTSAYGNGGGFHIQSRTIGGGGYAYGRPSAFSGPSAFHGGMGYHGGRPGFHGAGFHGAGFHGAPAAAPSSKHPVDEYEGGYHPHGGGRGGRGGRGGGGGGRGGGRR